MVLLDLSALIDSVLYAIRRQDVYSDVLHSVGNNSIFYIYPQSFLDLGSAQIALYLCLQPYSVQSKRINMTQEEIQDAIKTLWEADAMIPRTRKATHKLLVEAGIIEETSSVAKRASKKKQKAPAKKKKAKRGTK